MTPMKWKYLIVLLVILALAAGLIGWLWWADAPTRGSYQHVHTMGGLTGRYEEVFAVAVRGGEIFVSDGEAGTIWKLTSTDPIPFATGLETPSAIAFDSSGDLIVADSGSHTVKSISPAGAITILAGTEGRSGHVDGESPAALFNAPIGLAAAADGRIFVADTYNDRIRVIHNGRVSTLAGGTRGFADGVGQAARFDTPSGIAVWQDKVLIADTGNHRIRVLEPDGRVWTLAGNGESDLTDGLPAAASFVAPAAVAVREDGSVFVADGNAIRMIGGPIAAVRTVSGHRRGLSDGPPHQAQFNRPSGLAFDADGQLVVADSDNRLVRRFSYGQDGTVITTEQINALRQKPEEFRTLGSARWPYDPPEAVRDVAGTLGEIRGEMKEGNQEVWFHNGLDIAGAYGETARFLRDEKVLLPLAAQNFQTTRELIRMPTLGYIHIRLGRDAESTPFGDPRFLFDRDADNKLTGVRVPRGAKFKAGEPIGTLNRLNHVHLIAGRSGEEMNALDALVLPGITDSRPPVIERVTLADENWRELETPAANARIKLSGKARILVDAYDQVDGNSERRRLGVYRVSLAIRSESPAMHAVVSEIKFDRMPPNEAVPFVYARGSRSGATGETTFRYIATNSVEGDSYREEFLDASKLENGNYTLTVIVADYFGNATERNILIEVNR